jgi:transposase
MSKATRLQRKHQRAPADAQRGFGFAPGSFGERPQPPKKDGIPKARLPNFEAPDPFAIDINGVPVSAYLERTDQGWIVRLVEMLGDLDWSGFFPNYKPTGRPPVHPRLFLGLVVYGLLLGRSSLRDLETLARLDLGAWLVCAGLQPDHSSIGKFLQRHDALLTESYFEDLTKQLVARLKLGRGLAAIDGTVVAAAASRLSTLKLEAARQAAKEAAAKANALAQAQATGTPKPDAPPNPDLVAEASAEAQTSPSSSSDPTPDDQVPPGGVSSPTRSTPAPVPPSASAEREPQGTSASAALQEAQAQAAAAGEIARVAEARSATAQHPERIAVVPGELDAVIQPLKNGANHPSYKPSVIVHSGAHQKPATSARQKAAT